MTRSRAALAALVAALVALPAAAEISADLLREKLDAASEKLGGDYVRLGAVRTGGMSEGQTVKILQVLRKGACYRFAAVGGEAVSDLDLKVFAGGKPVASDQGGVPAPVAEYCARKDLDAEVRLQMFEGTGAYAIGVYAKGGAGDGGLSHGQAAAVMALEAYAARIAPDMDRLGDALSGSLGHRNSQTMDIQLDRARCYKFVAVGSEGVQDMTMSLTVDGEEVASDRISGQHPVTQWCSPGRVKVQVKLTMYGGSGDFAFGAYWARKSGAASPEKVGGPESDFVANRLRQLHAQYGKGRAAVTPVFRGNLSTNSEQVFQVKLSSGHCYTVIGAGSPSVKDLEISLLGRAGAELQKDDTRNGFPVMDTNPCPTFTGAYTVKVRMINGLGQFGVQVFSD
jgi:hypothetical protein